MGTNYTYPAQARTVGKDGVRITIDNNADGNYDDRDPSVTAFKNGKVEIRDGGKVSSSIDPELAKQVFEAARGADAAGVYFTTGSAEPQLQLVGNATGRKFDSFGQSV